MSLETQLDKNDELSQNKLIEESSAPVSSRFLWLIKGDEGYGVRRANLGIARLLGERSVYIRFLAMRDGPFVDELESNGFTVRRLDQSIDKKSIKKSGLRFLGACFHLIVASISNRKRIVNEIRAFESDWLHISINSLLFTGGMAASKAGVPAYWHIHNTISSKLPFGLQAIGFQILCCLFRVQPMANSEHTAKSLGSTFCSPTVLYPGIDIGYFSKSRLTSKLDRESLDLDSNLPLFLIAARLVENKGQDRVVEAFIDLAKSGQRVSLVLLGGPTDSEYVSRIKDRVRSSSMGRYIKIVGTVEDTRPYVEIADVIINSRIDAEPFGLSVVESMVLERPVLAYGLGGPSETIIDGKTGWLLKEPSVESYRQGILRAMKDRSRWGEMGRYAAIRAKSLYSLDATVKKYLETVASTQANRLSST